MTLARVLEACDTAAAVISAAWSPALPSAVSRTYVPDVGLSVDDQKTLIQGRQVYVFPANWGNPEIVSRAELLHEYALAFLVVERYTDTTGKPPDAWTDARVLFVETMFNLLKNPTTVFSGPSVSMFRARETPASLDEVYDLDLLLEQSTFWSRFTVTYHEIVGVAGS